MVFLLIIVGALVLVTAILAALCRGVLFVARRRPARYWRRALVVVLCSVPVHAFVTAPLVLGWVGSRMVHTRSDERAYPGPQLAADGSWVMARRGAVAPAGGGPSAEILTLQAADGVPLRAFLVPPRAAPARCTVVMVHGLFRGALELEPVGAMFRELGAEVLLLEVRNHGGSGRSGATFGLHESLDVAAAVEWVRARPGHGRRPVVLFGVSLGTAAVSLALRRIEPVAGVVLDAPISRMLPTAHRMLGAARRSNGRGILLPQPFRSLALTGIEMWSGFSFEDVCPIDALCELPATTAVLLVTGGRDVRVPPEEVRALFEALPSEPSRKQLWVRDASRHGNVWSDAPEGYRQRLAAFLDAAAPRGS